MKANFHTHSVFCDGNDAPAVMAAAAKQKGLTHLGFTGHSYLPFDPCGMTQEQEQRYRAAVLAERERYGDTLRIFLGIEQDYFSGKRAAGYDYALGSVHFVSSGEEHLCVDKSAEETRYIINTYFGGDPYAYAERYFSLVGDVLRVTGGEIVGHFDLLRKFDEDGTVFDESHPRYRAAVTAALDRLAEDGAIFEINTGAIARGYRKTPYPSRWILEEIRARGCGILINSDCHNAPDLDCAYEQAVELAKAAGFTHQLCFDGEKFVPAAF